MNNYKYELGEDPENECILIPRYKALGRVTPDGKRYSNKEIKTPDETDLVRVRSVITKFREPDIVTPDLIGDKFTDIDPGAAIGSSFGTSITEGLTQGTLALKHGGHERMLAKEGILKAPKAIKSVQESGPWLILKTKSGELKYPRPENLVLTNKTENLEEGEIVGSAYSTTTPIIKLNSLVKLFLARNTVGKHYYEKEDVIVADCYALSDGVIEYIENKGSITVKIGDQEYQYSPKSMYFYPNGTKIKKYQRFCSGVSNMLHVVKKVNLQDSYLIFRDQFYTLCDPGFASSGISSLHSIQEELIEMLYTSLINVDVDPKTLKVNNVNYLGTHSGVMSNSSFYTVLSYGYSSQVVGKAMRGELDIKNDLMTETVLGLLLNDNLDK